MQNTLMSYWKRGERRKEMKGERRREDKEMKLKM
jgi:hypothetical protein